MVGVSRKCDESDVDGNGNVIRVLIADDHAVVRRGLSDFLQFEADFVVVAEAQDGRQAIDLARLHSPDVVIMDIDMPVINGIDATRILVREMPHLKIIAWSMHKEEETICGIREAGAVAYLSKGSPTEDLVIAIRSCRAN